MRKSNLKRVTTIALAATMMFGSTMTVFAEAEPGTSTGTGTYEGGELKYPTLSFTLPTVPEGTYDYIADPNGLIAATDTAKYTGAKFDEGASGIFFKNGKTGESDEFDYYTSDSAELTLTNENAQDVDVTVKLEQQTAGSDSIKYASSDIFEEGDTEQKLYLAVTDGAAENAKVSALSEGSAAVITTTVKGTPSNYEPNYDSDTKTYGYVKKTATEEAPLTWYRMDFHLTGALNENATWGDDVIFPTIKVTWSVAEHVDKPAVALSGTYSRASASNVFTLSGIGSRTITKVEALDSAGDVFQDITGLCVVNEAKTQMTIDGTTAPWGAGAVGATRGLTITFNDGATATTSFVVNE